MEDSTGQHGWKEFHQNRSDILAEFDKLLEQTSNRPIKVAHGVGVEAYIRKWLSEFLPKKFGVTSGYIIPSINEDSSKIFHYDIIIYNQLDSPILWTESNEDQSEQGKYRAIPARHVIAIYEVKSRFTKKNVSDSIDKLKQLNSYKEQLNPLFSCGLIFIDLKINDVNKVSSVKELINSKDIFGFKGGIILRFEDDSTIIGKISLFLNKEGSQIKHKLFKPIAKKYNNLNIYFNEEGGIEIDEKGGGIKLVKTRENQFSVSKTYGVGFTENNYSIYLSWSRSFFSDFCINLLCSIEGMSINDERRPMFGQVYDLLEKREATLQPNKQNKGIPFLNVYIYDGTEYDIKKNISYSGNILSISFPIVVENIGEHDVVLSDDSFNNRLIIKKGTFGIKEISYELQLQDKKKEISVSTKDEEIRIQYRIVYFEENVDKKYYAIEKEIVILNDNISFV